MYHHGPISAVASSGPHIATAGYDNQLILWDAARKQAIARSLHDHLVNHCAFNSDGTLLASASSDYSARLWEVPSMRLKAALVGHEDDVDMAVFSPDDSRVATCALDRTIGIFDLEGRCLARMPGHTGNIISVAWTRDGKSLISSSVDGTVREWDAAAGKEIRCNDISVRTDTLAIRADGSIVAGDDKGRIVIIRNGRISYVQAHQAGIKKLVLDEASGILITLSYDHTIAVWQMSDQKTREISRSEIPALVWARSAALISAAKVAVGTFGSSYGVFDWQAGVWDLDGIVPDRSLNAVAVAGDTQYAIGDAGVLLADGRPSAHLGSLCNFLLAADDMLLTGGQLGRLFDAGTGAVLYKHHSPLNCGAVFLRHGRRHVIIGSYTGEVIILAMGNRNRLEPVTVLKWHENAVKGLAASEDRIFSVCANTAIAWHNIDDFKPIRVIRNAHEKIANGCCLAGKNGFASIGRDRKLRIWTDEREEVYETPHPNSVKCIAAGADHNTLMTGAYTGTLAGFDMKTREWRSFSRPTAAGISSLAFDSRRNRFLAGSYDGQIYTVT